MAKFRYSRTTWVDRYVPFGLFAGQASGVILLLVSLLLVMISGFRPALFDPVRVVTGAALAPTLSTFSVPFFRLAKGLDYLFSLTNLKAEVEKLRTENRRLEDWYNTAQLLQAENQSLRDLLKVKLAPGLDFVTARVVADLGGAYAQTIVVNVGTDDGIKSGDAVLAGEGLIGRVTAVDTVSARVLLMTDLSSRIPVRVEGSNVQAILAGTNGLDLMLTRLPEGNRLRNGQRVLTSGIGGVFPPDLPLGVIRYDSLGRVMLRPYADFGRLLYARVIKLPARAVVPTTALQPEVMP